MSPLTFEDEIKPTFALGEAAKVTSISGIAPVHSISETDIKIAEIRRENRRLKRGSKKKDLDYPLLIFAADTWIRAYRKAAERVPDGETARKMKRMKKQKEILERGA